WGITLLLTTYLLGSAIGGIVGGAGSVIGSAASAGGEGLKTAASSVGVSPDAIRDQAQAYLQPTDQDPASMSPEDAQKAIAAAVASPARRGRRARWSTATGGRQPRGGADFGACHAATGRRSARARLPDFRSSTSPSKDHGHGLTGSGARRRRGRRRRLVSHA